MKEKVKAAVEDWRQKVGTLTEARKSLEQSDVWNYNQRNALVCEAEDALKIGPFPIGRSLGWKYEIPEGEGR